MRGFTLIELMVTIAIGAILMAMAIGGYSSLRRDSLVASAGEQIVSTLHQARLRALSQRESQSVVIDYSGEGITDSRGNSYVYKGVNLQNMPSGTCTPGTAASETITFTARGSASAAIIKYSSADASKVGYIVINSVTGGIILYETCTGSGLFS
ncbi:MAG: prepilin-type N-terminal cleavage/methylation domain-containing protein [Mariprofundaceae bacterium]